MKKLKKLIVIAGCLILTTIIFLSSCRIKITAYLFDDPELQNTDFAIYADRLTEVMTGSVFSETTANPWQPPATFTLLRDTEQELEQEFTIAFRPRMNIRMEHNNFTNNNPILHGIRTPTTWIDTPLRLLQKTGSFIPVTT